MATGMPKIAIHKDSYFIFCNGNIRGARELSPIFPVSDTPMP
ncbi:hypothetical protein D081_1955 [Anaerovibrio sp. JC8]|nr:hypothetical protein D081_1955 [Anaerovibrio sp. JC8]